ncbi:mycothiol system anti-sigma-R factor [Dactylosporangium sp. CA-092794]|uniref:mycothiol system anti-sigma-R factor n=1 Tax=Dactylosporangium sp. CA-092794 TaxID=3239929 RepID=UPI003D8BF0D7
MSCGDPHETDCSDVLAEVYLYLDLECADDRRSLIRDHLDECSPCLREYGIEQEVKALVARCCGSELAPAELKARLRHKLSELVVNADTRELRTD